MSEVTIRRATPADAQTLAELGRETFTAKFAHLYPPDVLAGYLDDAHSAERYAGWLADPLYGVWLAEQAGAAVGYALAGPCTLPHPEVTPDCGELTRLYVKADIQGAGTGTRLMRAVLQWLYRPNRMIWVGVYSENPGAQRFYARHGFERVGEYYFPVGRMRDFEFILRRQASLPDAH